METSNMMYIQWLWINSKWTTCLWNTNTHLWGMTVSDVFILLCMCLTMWAQVILKHYYCASDFFLAFLCWKFLRMYKNVILSLYYWKNIFLLIGNYLLECGLDKKKNKASQLNYSTGLFKLCGTYLQKAIDIHFSSLAWCFLANVHYKDIFSISIMIKTLVLV